MVAVANGSAGDLVEPVAHRVGCEQGAQDRLVDAADHRCRLHRLDRAGHQPGEERLGQLRHELGRRAVAQLQPARRPGRSGEGQREGVPAGEGVDARGLLLREPARAQQRERLRLVEALQLQAPHQVLPARVRDPAGPRGLPPGDEQQEAVGQVRQEVLAQPCVEQAEGLVGVEADDRARRGGRQAPARSSPPQDRGPPGRGRRRARAGTRAGSARSHDSRDGRPGARPPRARSAPPGGAATCRSRRGRGRMRRGRAAPRRRPRRPGSPARPAGRRTSAPPVR